MTESVLSATAKEGGGAMEIIVEGTMPEKDCTDAYAGMCTQEPRGSSRAASACRTCKSICPDARIIWKKLA